MSDDQEEVVITNKFKIDHRYNHITVSFYHWDQLGKIERWCRDRNNGDFSIYASGICYKTDSDLSKFLLRWA